MVVAKIKEGGVRGMEMGIGKQPSVRISHRNDREAVSQRHGNNTGAGGGYLPVETKHRRLSRSRLVRTIKMLPWWFFARLVDANECSTFRLRDIGAYVYRGVR